MNILVTGGAGFIGANFIHYLFNKTDFDGRLVNFDKLTYAGNLASLEDIDKRFGEKRYLFVRGDICDFNCVSDVFKKYKIDMVIHFAAESHVDRSIFGPKDFIETNVNGTFNLLETARQEWKSQDHVRFHHVSTDEVYGSLGETGYFYENTPYDPRSPYSASKASSDHVVRAYYHTYGLPITVSNCSNNYGPYQFPEKLIPLIILNALEGKALPVYGDGKNIRDWLFVEDHCNAVWMIANKGAVGETYNIGGECEKQNIDVVIELCDILENVRPAKQNNALQGKRYRDLITYVKDRLGHDRRYAINCNKIEKELSWKPKYQFKTALKQTVEWYLQNQAWVESIRSGEHTKWIEKNYGSRPVQKDSLAQL